MSNIKFGTDGWRAIIAKEFTVDNVARITQATASWLLDNFENPSVVIGHDCRFAGSLFAETAAKVLAHNKIKVYLAHKVASTPMVSLANVKLSASAGIVLTASHNPPGYNGFKLKGSYGGPLLPDDIAKVEAHLPATNEIDLDGMEMEDLKESGIVEIVDLEQMYVDQITANFDLDLINNSGLKLGYDAMYGAGQDIMKRLLPGIEFLHCEYNPSFMGQAPEPILKNLQEFSELLKNSDIQSGLATDGDADRLGMIDTDGTFVDSHHLILLLIHYMCKYKGEKGKVCTAFSTTVKIKNMCDHYGLELEVVPIGFKHICEIMINEEILIGGEESGGIAIKGHIPERDGVWMGLIIWEFMAKSGKTLKELIEEVYEIVGTFAFERSDLHIKEQQKLDIIEKCKSGGYDSFGEYKVEKLDDLDGFKYFFNDNEWFMIRASGTEPVLRTYAESDTRDNALKILKAGYDTLLN
ncbi:MAG TPA: phosphoglucomutase/phosphomannomutase family protein [Flavobacteriales bacterium]|nr:phosphoglucomutase/phosphomannomutase family protein [Flavobacteriales bacterium]HIA10590.1 phosphoglucomutase/phosphomannomutase family protein [Flavobacteriales bacterium]